MTATSRAVCSSCRYPISTCVCDAIQLLDSAVRISILQHPSEQKHAKNTARLLPLLLPKAELTVGEIPTDFSAVQAHTGRVKNTIVLYPTEHAQALESWAETNDTPQHIIVLDGTWRKARKLWLSNPWLHELPCVAITPAHPSQYKIRKAPREDSLSTLEAVAHALAKLEDIDTAPFTQILSKLQSHWRGPTT
ncbi:tRNA-uridine aminocarboxypropyltransferase [Alteromonas flava]|uniref:tRNA-uridine aminocarboxypropyltransferase n=1 Tax=Alteromonas flava TaxID=2048003 RepID=UPI000C2872AB|nr:tRNA-uridine aminocarboxypropyltransferase [Alteromonas flava]